MSVIGNGFIGRNLRARIPESTDVNVYCQGMKDIVKCQQEPHQAILHNVRDPESFAIMHTRRTVHISSDHAYCEGPQSRTVYALTKRLGDEAILAARPDASIIITGHVYAPDCPWIVWLDGELKAGKQVVAYTNRICSPTWIGDLAKACIDPKPGRTFVLGRLRVDRWELYTAYAHIFGYDRSLIVPGEETNPLLIGDSSHASDVPTCDIYEGFERMREEVANADRPAISLA